MRSAIFGSVLYLILSGCRLPPEREPLKPLPEDGAQFTYAELLARARLQATAALEAFYIDSWMEVEDAAKALEQTARFLPKTTEQPAALKDTLAQTAADLGKEALELGVAARGKNVSAANEAMQQITLQIRELKSKQ